MAMRNFHNHFFINYIRFILNRDLAMWKNISSFNAAFTTVHWVKSVELIA